MGATIAAIDGLTAPIILIAGGVGKGADFSPMAAPIANKVPHVILFGEDADRLDQAIRDVTDVHRVKDLEQAIQRADKLA